MTRLFARLMLTLLRPALELHDEQRRRAGAEQARIDALESDRLAWHIEGGRPLIKRRPFACGNGANSKRSE